MKKLAGLILALTVSSNVFALCCINSQAGPYVDPYAQNYSPERCEGTRYPGYYWTDGDKCEYTCPLPYESEPVEIIFANDLPPEQQASAAKCDSPDATGVMSPTGDKLCCIMPE